MQVLSKKGVLFLTGGFNQTYIFQNVTHILDYEHDSRLLAILKTILSDGEIYISAVYYIKSLVQLSKCEKIKDFDLLKIQGTYEGASKPILITSLQILTQNHPGIYGKAPISLIDYLQSKVVQNWADDRNGLSIDQINHQEQEKVSKNDHTINKNPKKQVQVQKKSLRNEQDIQIDKPLFLIQKDIQIDQQDPDYKNFQGGQNQNNYKQKDKQASQYPNEQFIQDPAKTALDRKRYQRTNIEQSACNDPHKKLKPNQEQEEEGQMIIKYGKSKNPVTQTQLINPKSQQQKNSIQQIRSKPLDVGIINSTTQKKPEPKVIEIDVFDLDMMSTKKQSMPLYPQSGRKQIRKSHLKVMESIFESEQKSQKKALTENSHQQNEESITIVRSQAFNQQKSTPTKTQSSSITVSSYPRQMGTTTEKKKIRQEYNLLISNLYESNQSFKIICRVNYLYEWRSKNDVPCLALDLMDSQGDEIKAIIYMNHSTKDCQECGSMIEVGKVYCFQNGQCKRDYFEKQGLQLVFNLKAKPLWGKQITCGGKNKIIPTKIRIEPLLQHKVLSISKLIETFDSGKNNQTNVYGILQNIKISQYESKIKDPINQRQEDSAQIQIIQNHNNNQGKLPVRQQNAQKLATQGYTKLYLSSYLTDPLEKNKIFFTLVITKPKSENNQSSKEFLEKNMIKQGSLVVLHNVKVHANNTNTVRKLEKTKKTYLQLITNQRMTWKYNKQYFGAQIVVLPQTIDGSGLYSVFQEILSLSPIQLQLVYQNPKFLNYSQQPYTKRTIIQMNELLEKSILPEQSCFSEFKDVKLHSIEQKPSIELCIHCKKKVKSSENTLKEISGSDLIKHCARCKKIVKVITMHVFNIVFADSTASFPVEVLKDEYIETILGIKVVEFLAMTQKQKLDHLQLIKYTDFTLNIKSQNKVGGAIHKITTIEKFPVRSKIDQIHTERRGIQKHYKTLDSSW